MSIDEKSEIKPDVFSSMKKYSPSCIDILAIQFVCFSIILLELTLK